MWDGIPPCVTNVGDADDGGKGTKVRRLRDLMLSRTKVLRRQRVLPFNGGFKKGKKSCQIVQNASEPEPGGDGKREL